MAKYTEAELNQCSKKHLVKLMLDKQEQLARLRRNLKDARLRELTPRQRQMVELYYAQEMNTTAIAQLLGVQRSTVSRTLRRARARLYQFLRYGL